MQRRIALLLVSLSALFGGTLLAAAPAGAAVKPPKVTVGYNSCGQFEIYVNGDPIIDYVYCPV